MTVPKTFGDKHDHDRSLSRRLTEHGIARRTNRRGGKDLSGRHLPDYGNHRSGLPRRDDVRGRARPRLVQTRGIDIARIRWAAIPARRQRPVAPAVLRAAVACRSQARRPQQRCVVVRRPDARRHDRAFVVCRDLHSWRACRLCDVARRQWPQHRFRRCVRRADGRAVGDDRPCLA